MENLENELLNEEVNNGLEEVTRKPSKVKIIGIAALASVTALLLKFRKKIGTRIEGVMVKKLSKKGYTVLEPMVSTEIAEKIDETLLDNL